MLAFTRKTDYALIAMTHMALHPDECNSAREIANRYGVPLPLLMNILKSVTQKGLAQSIRGPRGGYRLAAPPTKISLNDIITAVEGPVQLVQCVDWYANQQRGKTKTGCELMSTCPVRPTIHRVHARLVEFLDNVTLADVVDNSEAAQSGPACGSQEEPLTIGGISDCTSTDCSSAPGERTRESFDLSR